MAANYTTVSASNMTDATGQKVINATISFQAVNANWQPINFRVGTSGQVITSPVSTTVTNGVFTIQLADTSLSNPVNISYAVSLVDNVTGKSLLTSGYLIQPTGSSWSLDTYIPTAGALAAALIAGPTGPAPNLTIGNVTTLSTGAQAVASLSGGSGSYTLNFQIPTGPAGPVGGNLSATTPLIAVGNGNVGSSTFSAHGDHQHPSEVTNLVIAPAAVSVGGANLTSGFATYPFAFTDVNGTSTIYIDQNGVLQGAGLNNYYQGTWTSANTYVAGSIIVYSGASYVALQKSSNVTPGTNTITWALLAASGANGATTTKITNSNDYKITTSVPGKLIAGSTIYLQTFTQNITLQPNFFGSTATMSVAPALSANLTVYQNANIVGNIAVFANANTIFSTANSNIVSLIPNDVIQIISGSPSDPNLYGLSITLAGSGPLRVPVDVVASYIGKPANSAVMLAKTFTSTTVFPNNFINSAAAVGTRPTATANCVIQRTQAATNTTANIGTVSIPTTGAITFVTTTIPQFLVGDTLTLLAPAAADATLSNLAITFLGSK